MKEENRARNRNQRSGRSECGDGEANRNRKVVFDHEKIHYDYNYGNESIGFNQASDQIARNSISHDLSS